MTASNRSKTTIPRRFRTPGHEVYVSGGTTVCFGDKRLYNRLMARGGDIDEPFDDIIVSSDAFGSGLTAHEAQWLAGVLKNALRRD